MTILVIAQARMGSTRLPGKVMMKLNGVPVIHHIIKRLLKIERADAVCVTTSTECRDDIIVEQALKFNTLVARGPEQDVLCRFAEAAQSFGAETIVRVTCDCPLIDPSLCDQLISKYLSLNCDYAVIGVEQGWPQGLDCEVFSAALLLEANKKATDPSDREHVTPWIIKNAKISTSITSPFNIDKRWVLDYEEDYNFLNEVFRRYSFDSTNWKSLLHFLNSQEDLAHKLETEC